MEVVECIRRGAPAAAEEAVKVTWRNGATGSGSPFFDFDRPAKRSSSA